VNIGIQDAVALAARLTAVIRDGAAETHLDGYEAQRRPIAAGVVAFTHRLTSAATMRGAARQAARNALVPTLGQLAPVRRTIAMNLSGLATDPSRKA